MPLPKVLVCFHVRPMCAGLFFREAFRQAGCEVRVAGPATPRVYGRPDGTDHEFPPEDFVAPDYPVANQPVDASLIVGIARAHEWEPDLVVMIDQYDPFYLRNGCDLPLTYVCVENWGALYAVRFAESRADYWYYMIAHSQEIPFPRPDFEFLPFGFDPHIHKYLPDVQRDKWACQIGTAYEPRPAVWNHLRAALDGAPPWSQPQYLTDLAESSRTLFGRTPSYRGMAEAYNRSLVALSSSNCDFSPMRTCEAYAMGCLLASDDVPAIRAVLGPPVSEGGFWLSHDRTAAGHERAVREGVEAYAELIDRGIAHVYKHHTYRARAERILARAGLQGAFRAV